MELDFEELIISEEQAHDFALSMFNDIRDYFLGIENIMNKLVKISTNVIMSTEGIFVITKDIFNYEFLKY